MFTPRLESLQYLDFRTRARPWDKLAELLREAKASKPQEVAATSPAPFAIADKNEQRVYAQMIAALRDEKWTWRTIQKLATVGGVSQRIALKILSQDPNVIFATGEKGAKIAKLKTR